MTIKIVSVIEQAISSPLILFAYGYFERNTLAVLVISGETTPSFQHLSVILASPVIPARAGGCGFDGEHPPKILLLRQHRETTSTRGERLEPVDERYLHH